MKLRKKRASSYVDKGNELMLKGKTEEAAGFVNDGLNYYANRIIEGINPFAVNDAALMVVALRTIANSIEKESDEGQKGLIKYLTDNWKLEQQPPVVKCQKPHIRH